MTTNKDEKCINCIHLKKENNSCPIANYNYYCEELNKIIHSTRLLIIKIEKLKIFSCISFKPKNINNTLIKKI